jgi:hypothetical protein
MSYIFGKDLALHGDAIVSPNNDRKQLKPFDLNNLPESDAHYDVPHLENVATHSTVQQIQQPQVEHQLNESDLITEQSLQQRTEELDRDGEKYDHDKMSYIFKRDLALYGDDMVSPNKDIRKQLKPFDLNNLPKSDAHYDIPNLGNVATHSAFSEQNRSNIHPLDTSVFSPEKIDDSDLDKKPAAKKS